MVGSKSLSRSAFLEVVQERVPGSIPGTRFWGVSRNAIQECIPGSLPGARSWRYSRNAFLRCVQEREI